MMYEGRGGIVVGERCFGFVCVVIWVVGGCLLRSCEGVCEREWGVVCVGV